MSIPEFMWLTSDYVHWAEGHEKRNARTLRTRVHNPWFLSLIIPSLIEWPIGASVVASIEMLCNHRINSLFWLNIRVPKVGYWAEIRINQSSIRASCRPWQRASSRARRSTIAHLKIVSRATCRQRANQSGVVLEKGKMDFYRYVTPEDRTIDANWQHGIRDDLLKGHLPLQTLPRCIPTCTKLYICSVFTGKEINAFDR